LYDTLEQIKSHLEEEKLAIDLYESFSEKQLQLLKPYDFLTFKPFVYALNVSENELKNASTLQAEYEQKLHKKIAIVSAKFETELMDLEDDERELFMDDLK